MRNVVGAVGLAALLLVTPGCLFAPRTFGCKGLVLPESGAYRDYLAECRSMSPELDSYCVKWGNPSAIKVGASGGYFVWQEKMILVSVGSFGRTRVLNSIPKDLAPYAFTGASVVRRGVVKMRSDASRQVPPRETTKASAEVPRQELVKRESVQTLYSVERFERVPGNEFAYEFVLDLTSDMSGISLASRVKEEIRAEILADYKATYTGERFQSIGVDFPKFAMSGGRIEGRAEVMQMRVMSLAYDQSTRKGVIAVKIGAARFDQARRWVRENIEILARDKNVALMTGELPSAGKFYLGAERVKDGNVLEIEFETE